MDKEGVDETSSENKVPARATLNWYEITMEAIPGPYDYNRNDYSYTIRYIISPYRVQNFNSKFYPIPKFAGIHKQYSYWFTGENTDVLDYQATFNYMYNMTMTGSEPGNNALAALRKKYTSSMRELTKYTWQAASDQTRSGAESDANEIGANAAESLYNPSDLAKGKVKIVGDPGWIQQGSIAGGVGIGNFNYSGFLPDGTINFDSQQVMFSVSSLSNANITSIRLGSLARSSRVRRHCSSGFGLPRVGNKILMSMELSGGNKFSVVIFYFR